MSSQKGKLKNFLEEVIHWTWAQFVEAENNRSRYTSTESIIISLVRNCAEGKLDSIKLTLDRMDGKVVTPVEIEYPKMYFIYPYAKDCLAPLDDVTPEEAHTGTDTDEDSGSDDVVTISLRQTVEKLMGYPRDTVSFILEKRKEVDADYEPFLDPEDIEDDSRRSPLVKSVVAANLVRLAEKRNFSAITEIFDRIDGKLTEVIKLGKDMYITQYAETAPAGSFQNKDGVWVFEAKQQQELWGKKLKEAKRI